MTDNPHQRALERADAQRPDIVSESDDVRFWEGEARRYAAIADALLLQWRDLASRVSKSSLRYDQDGD